YQAGVPEPPISEAAINAQALTVLMGDGSKSESNPASGNTGRPGYITNLVRNVTTTGNAFWENRHFDGANYAFADGHVKWLKPGKIGDSTVTTGYSFNYNTQ
ncbi:hypothetical protein EON80_26385, partial [bacterium]